LALDVQQFVDDALLACRLQCRLRTRQQIDRLLLAAAGCCVDGATEQQQPVSYHREEADLRGVVELGDLVGIGRRRDVLAGLHLSENGFRPVLVPG
jgi:hypothetical protein